MDLGAPRRPLTELASEVLAYLRRSLGGDVAYEETLRPLSGGFVTDVYSFSLDHAADGWRGPLVLRL